MRASEPLIIEDICVELARRDGGTVEVLRGVSLSVAPGRSLAVIGESGSGKTMTCRTVVGALPPTATISRGRVRIGERVLQGAARAPASASGLEVGMVFADPHAALDPLQRVGPQIAEMARVHRGLDRRASRTEALRLLDQVRVHPPQHVVNLYPFELSGGMAQRVMIASVLAASPRFLLADEPTSALDATIRLEILELLRRVREEEGVGMILTTHDVAVAGRACDEIAVMYAGKVVEHGTARRVLGTPCHPYTRLLLEARPRGDRRERLPAIPGEPPVPGSFGAGCAFAPRCPHAQAICSDEIPALRSVGDSRVACHFAESVAESPVEARR